MKNTHGPTARSFEVLAWFFRGTPSLRSHTVWLTPNKSFRRQRGQLSGTGSMCLLAPFTPTRTLDVRPRTGIGHEHGAGAKISCQGAERHQAVDSTFARLAMIRTSGAAARGRSRSLLRWRVRKAKAVAPHLSTSVHAHGVVVFAARPGSKIISA